MLRRTREWLESQKSATEDRVVVRLDSALVEPIEKGRGYRVVIEGFNLHPRIAPPLVKVGGMRLEQIQYQQDGRRIEGILKERPDSGPVTIDFGYAEAALDQPTRVLED